MKRRRLRGLTLAELLVTLVILSLLAGAALPYAETLVRREKELQLRRALRDLRGAIDQFHEDWRAGRIPAQGGPASEDGFPRTLSVLVDGVELGTVQGQRRRYLRRIPADPFAEGSQPPDRHWVLRGYQDERDTQQWNGRDVYDLRSASERRALDGSLYRDW